LVDWRLVLAQMPTVAARSVALCVPFLSLVSMEMGTWIAIEWTL